MSHTLSAKGEELMEMLPPYYQEDHVTNAVQDAFGHEIERFDDMVKLIIDGIFPDTATDKYKMLSLWEGQVGLAVAPVGLTEDQRRERVIARVRARRMKSGADWQTGAEAIIGATFTYQENQPNPYELTIIAPFPAGSPQFSSMENLIRPFTPAHINIIIVSVGGFIVDVSLVDQEVI